MSIFNISFYGKTQPIGESSNPLRLTLDFTSTAKEQPPEREITYICGLGAKVGCERLSEHSTCRDESHKYRLFLFLVVSVLLRKSEFIPIFLDSFFIEFFSDYNKDFLAFFYRL